MSLIPSHIKENLAPAKMMLSRSALSQTYKALYIAPEYVRVEAPFGIMEIRMQLGIPKPIFVDAFTFIGVVDSLPADKEMEFTLEDGALHWSCGRAKGRLALLSIDGVPDIKRKIGAGAWTPQKGFAEALQLGAHSGNMAALQAMGMYGVMLDNRNKFLIVASSDNHTAALAMLPEGEGDVAIPGAPSVMTLPPDSCAALAAVVSPKGKMQCDESSILYEDENTRLLVSQTQPLKYDPVQVMDKFLDEEKIVELPREAILSFIRRVAALSESRKDLSVTLHADNGEIGLAFTRDVAMSDEYFIAEGLKLNEKLSITLDATRLAKALAHVDEIVLDHIPNRAVIFRKKDMSFLYLVSGQK